MKEKATVLCLVTLLIFMTSCAGGETQTELSTPTPPPISTSTMPVPSKTADTQTKSKESSGKSGGSTTKSQEDTCTYKYSDGSVCGAKTNKYSGLCDKHFEDLYETYQSLGGTKVPK